jgi:hypothetical protein
MAKKTAIKYTLRVVKHKEGRDRFYVQLDVERASSKFLRTRAGRYTRDTLNDECRDWISIIQMGSYSIGFPPLVGDVANSCTTSSTMTKVNAMDYVVKVKNTIQSRARRAE